MRWIRQSLNWLAIKIIKRFFINYIPAHPLLISPLPILPPPLPSKCGTNTCKRPSFSFFFFFLSMFLIQFFPPSFLFCSFLFNDFKSSLKKLPLTRSPTSVSALLLALTRVDSSSLYIHPCCWCWTGKIPHWLDCWFCFVTMEFYSDCVQHL
jgi:hypothetical protein